MAAVGAVGAPVLACAGAPSGDMAGEGDADDGGPASTAPPWSDAPSSAGMDGAGSTDGANGDGASDGAVPFDSGCGDITANPHACGACDRD